MTPDDEHMMPEVKQRELEDLFEECSQCGTLFLFHATEEQQRRYRRAGRTELIQNIFPELPPQARAVLSQGNVCALCVTFKPDTALLKTLRPYLYEPTYEQLLPPRRERMATALRAALGTVGDFLRTHLTLRRARP